MLLKGKYLVSLRYLYSYQFFNNFDIPLLNSVLVLVLFAALDVVHFLVLYVVSYKSLKRYPF